MNAMVEMSDTGELKGSDFVAQEYVFSWTPKKDNQKQYSLFRKQFPTITQM